MVQYVIKQNGKQELYNNEKIRKSIRNAFDIAASNGDYSYLNSYKKQLENDIVFYIEKQLKDEEFVNFGTIIFLVEQYLLNETSEIGTLTGKEYILYYINKYSKYQDNLLKRTTDIINCKNVQNSNANVDEYSFSGRKFEASNELQKEIALKNFLSERVVKAHLENEAYHHDLDSAAVGMHNCLFTNLPYVLEHGFEVRNGNVRKPKSISTAMQQTAIIFQCGSQCQFGGIGSLHIDFDLAPYVGYSFRKYLKKYLKRKQMLVDFEKLFPLDEIRPTEEWYEKIAKEFHLDNLRKFNLVWNDAMEDLEEEGAQAAEAFYSNLNSMESRCGSQLPFTSINYGRDTSVEGRMVTRWLLQASIDGIGKNHETPIFPIAIFMLKGGINKFPEDPNYDLYQLAIKSLSKRIYPNIVNNDWSQNVEDIDNPDTYFATMGCRSFIGYDEQGMGHVKQGRGNAVPVTIILPKLALKAKGNEEEFYKLLDYTVETVEMGILERFNRIASQNPKSAPFLYKNGTIADADKCIDNVYNAQKHNTLGLGYLGLHETCMALYGKGFYEDKEVYEKALNIVKYLADKADELRKKHKLNFSLYATPAESLSHKAMKALQKEFGIIEGITDREFLTNSHHVPVFAEVSIMEKLSLEAPFCKYPKAGCITYIECDGSVMNNAKGVEEIINYAMSLDIPYLALNIPLDMCNNCGLNHEIENECPVCGSTDIKRLRRVTGYLSTDYRNFNKGKQQEVEMRVKHSRY